MALLHQISMYILSKIGKFTIHEIFGFIYFVVKSTTNIRRLPSIRMFLFCCSIVVVYYRHLCVYVFITINGPKPEKGLFSVMSQNIALLLLFVNSAESSLLPIVYYFLF